MKDICVFFGEGYEEIEALTVVDILRRASVPVKMVSITESDHKKKKQLYAYRKEVKLIMNLQY